MASHSHRLMSLPAYVRRASAVGTVAAPHESSIRAGLEMFDAGGNAVDAAVAAALVAGVVEPTETTLAGSGFLLLAIPGETPISVEFGPVSPAAAHAELFAPVWGEGPVGAVGVGRVEGDANITGPLAHGVPRTLLGLLTAQERFGLLDRATVLAPAIAAAEEGFIADAWFTSTVLANIGRLRQDPYLRSTFLTEDGLPIGSSSVAFNGMSFEEPERVYQPVLAQTLRDLSAQPLTTLTTGSIAQRLLHTANEAGSLLSPADLAASAPAVVTPLNRGFLGHDLWVPHAPTGGITELQILLAWQATLRLFPPRGERERLLRLNSITRHAFADRYHWLADPDEVSVPIDGLLSNSYADALAELAVSTPAPFTGGTPPWAAYAGTALHDPWVHERESMPSVWAPHTAAEPTSGTTHVSAADETGAVVTITHTAANAFGSAFACPRTGLLFDAAMAWFNPVPGAANSVRGGARPLANMGPMVVTRHGVPEVAIGATGGRRIISAVTQVVIELLERGTRADAVLSRPRFDASGTTTLVHENLAVHLSPADLACGGFTVLPAHNHPYTFDFARVNAAMISNDGIISTIDPMAFAR